MLLRTLACAALICCSGCIWCAWCFAELPFAAGDLIPRGEYVGVFGREAGIARILRFQSCRHQRTLSTSIMRRHFVSRLALAANAQVLGKVVKRFIHSDGFSEQGPAMRSPSPGDGPECSARRLQRPRRIGR